MHTLLLNLPFMIFATALILGILSAGMYLEYRKVSEVKAAVERHPSSVTKLNEVERQDEELKV